MTITNTEGLSDAKLGRFDHHPDPAIDFEIEVQSLEARLFDAKGGISKPGTEPETVETVGAAIERAMTFTVGGDPSAVAAKATLRNLEKEAWDHVHAKVTDDLQALGEEFGVLGGENRISGLRRVLTEMRSELSRRAANSAGRVEVKARFLSDLAGVDDAEYFAKKAADASWQDLAETAMAALKATRATVAPAVEAEPVAWQDGEPPLPHRNEWFIAETVHGDRVVLRALPEEWTYDYTTADGTRMATKSIKRWMQFPDSEYLFPHPCSSVSAEVTEEQIEQATKAANAVRTALEERLTSLPQGVWTAYDEKVVRAALASALNGGRENG